MLIKFFSTFSTLRYICKNVDLLDFKSLQTKQN